VCVDDNCVRAVSVCVCVCNGAPEDAERALEVEAESEGGEGNKTGTVRDFDVFGACVRVTTTPRLV